MSTALTSILGTAIKAFQQPRKPDHQLTGFAGAHGLTGMHMGTRGRKVFISGRLAAAGANYATARANLVAILAAIEPYLWAGTEDYTYGAETFESAIWISFQLVPDARGKVFHWTSEGNCVAKFVAVLQCLI